MMKKTLLILGTVLMTQGCGGGGGETASSNPAPTPDNQTPVQNETPVNTAEIEVSANFDFRTDSDIEISIANQVPGEGMVNLYYGSMYHDVENDIYYPDYSTRVMSFDPNATSSVTIQANRNWDAIYAEFVPTYAGGKEQYFRIELNAQTTAIVFN